MVMSSKSQITHRTCRQQLTDTGLTQSDKCDVVAEEKPFQSLLNGAGLKLFLRFPADTSGSFYGSTVAQGPAFDVLPSAHLCQNSLPTNYPAGQSLTGSFVPVISYPWPENARRVT